VESTQYHHACRPGGSYHTGSYFELQLGKGGAQIGLQSVLGELPKARIFMVFTSERLNRG
jgi:hypothetical protein